MKDVLYMAWRYVRFNWGKTVLLVSAISLVLFLPAGLHVVVEQGARTLTTRAESTPLLIGAKGSAMDRLMEDFSGLTAQLIFLEDGLHAIVTVDRK